MTARHEPTGPIESFAWPARLPARVATAGGTARIHGYAVRDDLARHYTLSDQVLLALTGELPDEPASRAFAWAMQLLGVTSVAEAPVHCAVVARLCGAAPGSAYAAGFTTLTEQATDLVGRHEALLAYLERGGAFPAQHVATDDGDRELAAEAARVLALDVPALACSPSSEAALLAILHRIGLRTPAQLVAAISFARLPVLIAEVLAQPPLAFRDYPMDLPDFVADLEPRR